MLESLQGKPVPPLQTLGFPRDPPTLPDGWTDGARWVQGSVGLGVVLGPSHSDWRSGVLAPGTGVLESEGYPRADGTHLGCSKGCAAHRVHGHGAGLGDRSGSSASPSYGL